MSDQERAERLQQELSKYEARIQDEALPYTVRVRAMNMADVIQEDIGALSKKAAQTDCREMRNVA